MLSQGSLPLTSVGFSGLPRPGERLRWTRGGQEAARRGSRSLERKRRCRHGAGGREKRRRGGGGGSPTWHAIESTSQSGQNQSPCGTSRSGGVRQYMCVPLSHPSQSSIFRASHVLSHTYHTCLDQLAPSISDVTSPVRSFALLPQRGSEGHAPRTGYRPSLRDRRRDRMLSAC
jgi:hypothetical protein